MTDDESTRDAITRAIQAHLLDKEWIDQGEYLGDWIVVAHLSNIEPEEPDGYVTISSTGSMSVHAQTGLLAIGQNQVFNAEE